MLTYNSNSVFFLLKPIVQTKTQRRGRVHSGLHAVLWHVFEIGLHIEHVTK